MKNIFYSIFILLALFAITTTLSAQGFMHRSGKKILDASGNEIILRGIGTGNWLLQEGYMMKTADFAGTQTQFRNKLIQTIGEANTNIFYEHWLNNHFTRRDVDSMKVWGFNSVRVAMHYKWFTLPIEDEPVIGQDTWFESGFVRIDSLLRWCEDNEIYLILDLHGAPGGQGHDANISDYDPTKPSLWESAENRRKTVALWKKLAQRYANKTWIGGYDLINEPNWDLPNGTLLKQTYVNITNAIREVDQNHMIIIEGNWFANDYTGLTPPWDNNMVYSFHKYWTYNTQESIQWMINLRNTHNIPIWLGESGENSNSWFTSLIALCEANDIGWSWWPVKKAGINNVLMVPESPSYNNLISFWKTGSPQMTAQQAFDAVLDWAENHRIQNCTVQRDVIDAMIRQPHQNTSLPFKNHHVSDAINFSDYDLGKCSVSYWDTDTANYHLNTNSYTSWNQGWSYRNDGVDIEACNDNHTASNGLGVGWTEAGEWMQYTIQSDSAAAYQLMLRSASNANPGIVRFLCNDVEITAAKQLPNTGGWQSWATTTIDGVILPGGTNKIKVYFNQGGSNVSLFRFLNPAPVSSVSFGFIFGKTQSDDQLILTLNKAATSVEFNPQDLQLKVNGTAVEITHLVIHPANAQQLLLTTSATLHYGDVISLSYTGTGIQSGEQTLAPFDNQLIQNMLPHRFVVPVRVQAEDFDYNNGFQLEDCTDINGGKNIGFANNGDYVDYNIFVPEAGQHKLTFRLASIYSNGRISLRIGEGSNFTALATLAVNNTGGWQTWKSQTIDVNLPAGNTTFRLYSTAGEYNINWFEFNGFTDIPETNQLHKLELFPNPSDGSFYVKTELRNGQPLNLNLKDVAGRTVASSTLQGEGEVVSQIDCGHCETGTYLLHVQSGEGTLTRKVVLQ